MTGRQCTAARTDGSPCEAMAMTGKEYCHAHDPESRESFLEASSKGGSVTQWRGHELIAVSDLEEIQTPKDVLGAQQDFG